VTGQHQRGPGERDGARRERAHGGRRLRVNPIGCDGHGLCADLFPEMIKLDEWGYPLLDGRDVPAHLLVHARRAVVACPTLALALTERTGPAERAAPAPAAAPAPYPPPPQRPFPSPQPQPQRPR
jgi:ferredoxin